MKKIEAIIKPTKLDDVKDALHKLGINGMTVTDARGFGRQKGQVESYRGSTVRASFITKVLLVAVVADSMAEKVVDTIIQNAKTGQIGDGKVFVSDVAQVYRIRTGEKGDAAI
jgi:nitrogen regulatory protein P-II 1